ncbi:hypothetical protein [Streptomyces sp. NRRL B-3648]|uniref:hypothetical protein n=1 Tax=Streptomyces sp. NRRL B-3648 TaxID=1519493 RepID=UPI00131CDF72|nr:hypothetical protein [Streptomyces sp. NRRL B-3648]
MWRSPTGLGAVPPLDGDVSRLVAPACDTRWQERLRGASGADLEAVTEVLALAAFNLVLGDGGRRGDQDVSVALAADASAGYARVRDLAEVAEGLHHTDHPAERDELLRRVISLSRTLADPPERTEGLERVAQVFGRIGKPDGAAEPAQETLGLAGTAGSPSRRRWDTSPPPVRSSRQAIPTRCSGWRTTCRRTRSTRSSPVS